MTESTASNNSGGLPLPKDWWSAPFEWAGRNPSDFWIFVLVNFLFGTLALWLPLINAGLGGHSTVTCELIKLLEGGAFYMYGLPFLAATVGVAFASLVRSEAAAEQTRGTKVVLIFTAISVFVVAAILLQIQTLGPDPSHRALNFEVQIFFSLLMVIIGLYFQALVQNETGGSPQADMQDKAKKLRRKATGAKATTKDFQ